MDAQMIDVVSSFALNLFAQFRPIYEKVQTFVTQMVKGHSKFWVSHSFNGFVAIGSLLSFLFAATCAYLLVFPSSPPNVRGYQVSESRGRTSKCNVFEGSWIPHDNYPLYNASQCPFAERGFDCLANGRKDRGYLKWRWKPKNCDIPRFDARAVLEKLRGKRVVFVGDSLSRTQWESLICMLMTGVDDKSSVYEINGNGITKRIGFLGVLFRSFGIRIDFYRSVFLVQPASAPKRAPKRVKSTVRLDELDEISREWVDSDILLFNSAHWWTTTKLFDIQGLLFSDRRIREAWDANQCCI